MKKIMSFDIFNIFPYIYLNVIYWTGKSVHTFLRKQVISGNFRRYDVYSWVCIVAAILERKRPQIHLYTNLAMYSRWILREFHAALPT